MTRMKMLLARTDVYILVTASLLVSFSSDSGVVGQFTSPATGQNTQRATSVDGTTIRTSSGTGNVHSSSSGELAGATFAGDAKASDELWTRVRHKHQKVRLKVPDQGVQSENPAYDADYANFESGLTVDSQEHGAEKAFTSGKVISPTPTIKPFWIQIMSAATKKSKSPLNTVSLGEDAKVFTSPLGSVQPKPPKKDTSKQDKKLADGAKTDAIAVLSESMRTRALPGFSLFAAGTTGAPKLENKLQALDEVRWDGSNENGSQSSEPIDSLELDDANGMFGSSLDDPNTYDQPRSDSDLVSKFLRVVESQHMLGDNCTAGTETTLGEGVVDRYAQERFRLQAEVAVNRANWLTRMWKYADKSVLESEYLLHVNLYSIIEMDENIFAAGNCYDGHQYKDYALFCPFAYRLPEGPILAKDLAMEYKYLSNTSEWFYIARKNAERVISNMTSLTKAYHVRYIGNDTSQTERIEDEILFVSYEDGKWTKPYYDCGGGNIWMMTYTVPFFGYADGKYFFKGTSGIDIDLRRVDIDQCPPRAGNTQLNIFAASDRCKSNTTRCVHIPGLGFRRGSYRCECKDGFYFPDKASPVRYYNGTSIEEEYEKKLTGQENSYDEEGKFECLPCPEGCDVCVDDSPCIISLNWGMRTTILILEIIVICALPVVAIFTWRYSHIKVVRAASPALLRFIILGAFFIYCTILVAYTRPNMITCSLRVWLREIGFSFAYGALLLKTWRISIIFRVRSAKAVKITDLDLIKRLGVIVSIFAVFLSIRTIVGPPRVIVGKTADDLKAFICETDWWDHVFTAMEMVVLVWGIRLCIVVRKAPSEFNESRFISMAIYNEFLLSIFLNVSMLFLQSPANPDLLYIIMFSHTQLTTTLLLVLIFGSKAYLVLRGRGKGDDSASAPKPQAAKFLTKPKTANHSTATASVGSFRAEYIPELSSVNDPDTQAEIRRILAELEQLRERSIRTGNPQFATRLAAMSQAARQVASPVTAIDVVDAVAPGTVGRLENGPSGAIKEMENDLCQRKSSSVANEKKKSPKNSPDSGLGGLMFNSGPTVNNVLACMTDKIVCATFSADPALVAKENVEESATTESPTTAVTVQQQPGGPAIAPVSSLALAAAPLLTSNFAFDTRGVAVLHNHSAPNSRRSSDLMPDVASSVSAQLSLVGNHANSRTLMSGSEPTSLSVHSLCHLPNEHVNERRQFEAGFSPASRKPKSKVHYRLQQFSPNAGRQVDGSPVNGLADLHLAVNDPPFAVDSSVHSAQVTDGVSLRSLSRSRINTEDRECFTDEMTV